jgi:NTE family protein
MNLPLPGAPNIALVLSGGGARGAYEAGVLAGVFDLRGTRRTPDRTPFDVFTGTSVGAITAAHLAASADRSDHGIADLLRQWTSLRLDAHLRLRLGHFLGSFPQGLLPQMMRASKHGPRWGRALLDSRPLERMVENDGAATAFLQSLAALGAHVEADLLSYLLFDGEFARTLIELGRADARERRDEVLAFFA